MKRERALKILLVVVGLLFTAGVVPLTMFFSREPSVPARGSEDRWRG
jgi:flagellar basal body-associated protein FliL